MKAAHLTELRTAVHAVRTLAGLSASSWTDASPLGLTIKAVHITELRSALDQAFQTLTLPAISYANPALSAIRAIDISELRSAVK